MGKEAEPREYESLSVEESVFLEKRKNEADRA